MTIDPADIPLLRDAPEAWSLLGVCPRRQLVPGQVLITPGNIDKVLFIVVHGRLDVHVDTLVSEPVAQMGPGQHLGEVSLVDGLPRSAWVVCVEAAELVVVSERLFWEVLERWPMVTRNVLRSMARKVRGGNLEVSESRKLQAEYQRHASFDQLTGLFNRRWLAELLPRQVERARRDEQPLSLVMVDVDHFKRFNDTYGHPAGDYVLFAVGQRLRRSFRPTDLVARYGGEEFLAVLPDTPGLEACMAAERVRRALENEVLVLEDGTEVQVTASLGVAEYRAPQSDADLVAAADRALYQAKGAGRNRVATWGEVAVEPLPGLF